jgi:hypothetical protein
MASQPKKMYTFVVRSVYLRYDRGHKNNGKLDDMGKMHLDDSFIHVHNTAYVSVIYCGD